MRVEMHTISLVEAKEHLAELVADAANGEEVIITQEDGSAFKIIPVLFSPPRPKFGSAKGQVKMSDNFDEPLEDFGEYAP